MLATTLLWVQAGAVSAAVVPPASDEIYAAAAPSASGTASPAAAEQITAMFMPQTIMVNDEIVEMAAYNINGNNYCKLRSLGWAMNFDVQWDENGKNVQVNSKAPYQYEGFSETYTVRARATRSNQPIYMDGKLLENLTIYHIEGNNYFKLRELGEVMNFSVIYNTAEKRVEINEAYGYDPSDRMGEPKFVAAQVKWGEGEKLNYLPGRSKRYADYRSGYAINNYFFKDASGNIAALHVDADGKRIYVESYRGGSQMEGQREIPFELDVFGAFLEGRNNYYIAFGQYNTEQNDGKEVYRLVKYDKNWNRLGAASVKGGESYTRIPYYATIGRMAESDDGSMVALYTARERYSDANGINHQSNFMMTVNAANMSVNYASPEFPENHASHSFGQFAKFDNGSLVTVDHGDAFPRSVILHRNLVEKCTILNIAGIEGDNNTNAISVGFEVSGSNYLYLGCSASQEGGDQENLPMNVFLGVAPKVNLPYNAKIIWLTAYDDDITAARLVKLGEDRFAALWQHGSDLEYVVLDGAGRTIKEKTVLADTAAPPVQPVVLDDGRIAWFQLPFEMEAGYRKTGEKVKDITYLRFYSISV
jgi:hypothetical protein